MKRRCFALLPEIVRAGMIRRQIHLPTALPRGVQIRQAQSIGEVKQALQLLHDQYVNAGLMKPKLHGLRFTKYHALPWSYTLIAEKDGEVVATVTLIVDSWFGLPCQSFLNLTEMRNKFQRLVEVSSLAVAPTYQATSGSVLFYLLKYLYLFSKEILNSEALVIAVHPKHFDFYRHLWLFEPIRGGKISKYPFVGGHPAAAGYLDLKKSEARYKKTFGNRTGEITFDRFLKQKDERLLFPQIEPNGHLLSSISWEEVQALLPMMIDQIAPDELERIQRAFTQHKEQLRFTA